jgi:hypothetical protein
MKKKKDGFKTRPLLRASFENLRVRLLKTIVKLVTELGRSTAETADLEIAQFFI